MGIEDVYGATDRWRSSLVARFSGQVIRLARSRLIFIVDMIQLGVPKRSHRGSCPGFPQSFSLTWAKVATCVRMSRCKVEKEFLLRLSIAHIINTSLRLDPFPSLLIEGLACDRHFRLLV